MFNAVITAHNTAQHGTVWPLVFTILLSFILSSLLAFVYQKTFRGLSYAYNGVQAIILISVIATIVIQSVDDSLSRSISIMMAMSVISFRSNFKDPRDVLFMFAALIAGISCGAYSFTVAIVGTLSFSVATAMLYYSSFLDPNRDFECTIKFKLPDTGNKQAVDKILNTCCQRVAALETGKSTSHKYHIKLRKNMNYEKLMVALKTIEGLEGIVLMMKEATVDL